MPAPGLDLGGTKASVERQRDYWKGKATAPCAACEERRLADERRANDDRLRAIVREELSAQKA